MRGQSLHLSCEGIDDELYMLGRNPLNRLLDYMIAVLVFDAPENVFLQFFDQCCLLVGQNVLQRLGSSVNARAPRSALLTFCTTRHPYICRDSVKT